MKAPGTQVLAIAGLTAAVRATPVHGAGPVGFQRRQEATPGDITRNDLENGNPANCARVIFIFARATGEPGNMGITAGPNVAHGLADHYGDELWVQGVGPPYNAAVLDNALPEGTTQDAIGEATRMFNMANQKCPNAAVAAGGYSQGTAVMAGSISTLAGPVQDQIRGVVLFGYTRNQQNGGEIPNFPPDRLRVFCAPGDLVCNGTLLVTPSHVDYGEASRTDAPQWLIQRIGSV